MSTLLIFIAGLMVGGTAGVVGMSLCVAAGRSEKEIARSEDRAIISKLNQNKISTETNIPDCSTRCKTINADVPGGDSA